MADGCAALRLLSNADVQSLEVRNLTVEDLELTRDMNSLSRRLSAAQELGLFWVRLGPFGPHTYTYKKVDFSIILSLFGTKPMALTKNRCQDTLHFGLHFLTDFWYIRAPNFDPG